MLTKHVSFRLNISSKLNFNYWIAEWKSGTRKQVNCLDMTSPKLKLNTTERNLSWLYFSLSRCVRYLRVNKGKKQLQKLFYLRKLSFKNFKTLFSLRALKQNSFPRRMEPTLLYFLTTTITHSVLDNSKKTQKKIRETKWFIMKPSRWDNSKWLLVPLEWCWYLITNLNTTKIIHIRM